LAAYRQAPRAALISFGGLNYQSRAAHNRDPPQLLCLVTEAPDGASRQWRALSAQCWTFWPLGVHALTPQASTASRDGPVEDAV